MWVHRSGVDIPEAELLEEVSEEVRIELSPVVRDQTPWDPKFCNYALPHKVPRVLLGDGGQRFGFDPLGEIIDVATSYSLEFDGVVPQYPSPTERRAIDWRVGSAPAPAGEGSARTSGIFYIFWCTTGHPFACRATSSLG